MTFTELIEYMRSTGISSLADIARALDVSPQSVSNWKARDQVPHKYVIFIQNKYNADKEMAYSDIADTHGKVKSSTADNSKDHLSNIKQNSQDPSQFPFEEEAISIVDILIILMRHIKLIIIIPIIFCIYTIVNVLFFSTPIYQSTATFMSSMAGGSTQSLMGAKGLASQFGFSFPTRESGPNWSYIEVIKSRTMAKSLLQHRFDTDKYGPQKTLLQILTSGNEEPLRGIDTLIKHSIDAIQGMITITSIGSMYELKTSAFEPQLASDIGNAVMEKLDRHLRDYNSRKIAETRQFIEKTLIDTKIELEASEEALKVFRERNRSILESPQLLLEQERLSRDLSVLTAVFTTLKQQLETAKIDEVKESDYVVILDPPNKPLYPSSPKKKRMVILAGFFGLGLGILIALFLEYANSRNSSEKEKMREVKLLIIKNISVFLPFFSQKHKTS